jgi:hypothetical protein
VVEESIACVLPDQAPRHRGDVWRAQALVTSLKPVTTVFGTPSHPLRCRSILIAGSGRLEGCSESQGIR